MQNLVQTLNKPGKLKTGLTEGSLWEHQPGRQELSFAPDLRECFCVAFLPKTMSLSGFGENLCGGQPS